MLLNFHPRWCSAVFIVWASSYALLGRTRSRGRCWAAIRLCRHPETSGHVLHMEFDGLEDGGQHGQRSVPLCHTHRPQKGPYPTCVNRSGNVRHRCGSGYAGPTLFLGPFQEDGCRCREWKCGVWYSALQPLRIPSVIRPERRTSVVVLSWTDEL